MQCVHWKYGPLSPPETNKIINSTFCRFSNFKALIICFDSKIKKKL